MKVISHSIRCATSDRRIWHRAFHSWHRSPSAPAIFASRTRACIQPHSIHRRHSSAAVIARTASEPTIYALSSAPGRAAIAVVRISGQACLDVYKALCPEASKLKARRATVRALYEPGKAPSYATVLDSSALLLYFPGPASATGEEVLELHVHGGPAVVKAVLRAIQDCNDVASTTIRYAEPGEFTYRAFLNNRLDLTQVEALGDILAADTEQQRLLSMRGTSGSLSKQYESWRQQLLHARGELEALIDFSEDQHFDESPDDLCASVAEQVHVLIRHLEAHSQNAVRGEMLRNGISISLLGAPNAGKSSLLNRIVQREAAIVSHEAGTTRDVVEIGLDLGGYLCRLGDTAGLRSTARGLTHATSGAKVTDADIGHVEQEGMRRAKERASDSDVVIVVLSLELGEKEGDQRPVLPLDPEVCATAARLAREKDNVMIVINKADLLLPGHAARSRQDVMNEALAAVPGLDADSVHLISCREAERRGVDSTRPRAMMTTTATADVSPSLVPSPRDPGGIQHFLNALVGRFAKLTAAVSSTSSDHAATSDLPEVAAGAAAAASAAIWQESLGATERHRVLLESCLGHLRVFVTRAVLPSAVVSHDSHAEASDGADIDLVAAAEELRSAADCLAKITGKGESGDVEEVLGVVFEKFCVGK